MTSSRTGPTIWLRTLRGGVAGLKTLLEDFSLDPATFVGTYGMSQDQVIGAARELVNSSHELVDSSHGQSLETLCQTAILFGEAIELSSKRSTGGEAATEKKLGKLNDLIESDPNIPDVICQLYSLSGKASPLANMEIDWRSLRLHQVGTTSLIFVVHTNPPRPAKLVLKLLHIYFINVGPLATQFQGYKERWQSVGQQCENIVQVHASGTGWILEEFVDGKTLDQFIRDIGEFPSYVERLDYLNDALMPIVDAVINFHTTGKFAHSDITPSNIILQPREVAPGALVDRDDVPYVARLIDMGRNYLASTTIGRVSSPEVRFIAPEVVKSHLREDEFPDSADFYSLGVILGELLRDRERPAERDPVSACFDVDPLMARICADLMDHDPKRRLGVLAEKRKQHDEERLSTLREYLAHLIEALKHSGDNRLRSDRAVRIAGIGTGLAVSMPDAASSVARLARRNPKGRSDYVVLQGAERIAILRSGVSLLAITFGLALIIYTALLDLGWAVSFGRFAEAMSYDPSETQLNWQVRLVGGSFIIAAFQYVNIPFWRISFLKAPASRLLRVASESLLWLSPLLATLITAVALAFPSPWLWYSASALFVTMATNETVASLRNRLRDSRVVGPNYSLMSAPVDQAAGVTDLLGYWNPTLRAYTGMVVVLAMLWSFGRADDMWVYAGAIAIVNLVVFVRSQLVKQGPILRRSLGRVMIYGERAKILGPS